MQSDEKLKEAPYFLGKLNLESFLLVYVDMEGAGTGGGNLRSLYSGFLKEASVMPRNRAPDKANDNVATSAELRTKTANCFLKASESAEDKLA